ncbi:hypothetical protein MPSEU_000002600 [Mayamaea pseudoterrestris]|nr:hypothetical protein MPSEU_000002600 [Mayamaea pseudoterrestris]
MDHDEDDFAVQLLIAQQESLQAIARQTRRQQEDEESLAMQRAIEASRLEHDTHVARQLHDQELSAADHELAMACEESSQAAQHYEHQVSLAMAADHSRSLATQEQNHGSWDCPNCTLVNEPYQPSCRACNQRAPSHVLVFKELPSNIAFGVELEMMVTNGLRDGFTLQSLAQDLTRLGPERILYEGYSHATIADWKIVTDGSIRGVNGQNQDLCFELVSPVLKGHAGISQLRRVMEIVRKLGIATNASCGFHVHVDAEPASSPLGNVAALKRISNCFVALENAFDLLVALTWDNHGDNAERRANKNSYCQSNRLAFGEQSNQQRWSKINSCRSRQEVVDMINPRSDRYRKLNLTNIVNRQRPSTCEFRNHGGVVSIPEAEAWVRLILLFCRNAGSVSDATCLLPEGATPKMELQALFRLVDCHGLEEFFVVERRLFADHRLSNDWECRICRKRFVTSRSLAQHAAACRHY